LIADRDEQFRFYVRGLFKHHRVREVLSVTLANEIPHILAHHEIHIAFVELPHEDSGVVRMLQWLRGSKDSPAPQLPVILLTKALDKAQLARVCAFGIHGILQKPVSGEKLMKAVMGVAANPRMFKSAGKPVAVAKTSKTAPAPVKPPVAARAGVRRPAAPAGGSIAAASGDDAAETSGGGKTYGFLSEDTPKKKSDGGAIEVLAADPSPESRSRPDEAQDIGKAKAKSKPPVGKAEAPVASVESAIAPVDEPEPPKKADKASGPSIEEILAAHLLWARGGGREGQRANLTGRDLCGMALVDAVLTSAVLRRADLSGCDLSGAELHGADLRDAEIPGGKFVGADLAVARLRHAKLRGCLFSQASLKGADLAGADLTGAKMGDADLAGAILVGARLDDADLSNVSGLTQGQLDGVEGNAGTRLPPGLSLPSQIER
jgi:DNA-binding NarL/FixJ family response regulator